MYYSAPLAADIAAAIAAELGLHAPPPTCPGWTRCDWSPPADALNRKQSQYQDRWGLVALTDTPFAPVVDGEVLPATPWQALAAGAARDVPLIAGHNHDESRLFLAMSGQLGGISDEKAARFLRALGPGADGEQAYRAAFPGASAERLYELVQNGRMFWMPTQQLAEAQAAGGGVAYLYELAWPAPANGGILGACHGLDGPLVFGNLDDGLAARLIGPAPYPAAEEVSAQFRTAWTRFAAPATPAGPPTTRSAASPASSTCRRRSPPTRRKPPASCGRTTPRPPAPAAVRLTRAAQPGSDRMQARLRAGCGPARQEGQPRPEQGWPLLPRPPRRAKGWCANGAKTAVTITYHT